MERRARYVAGGMLLIIGLSGCPVTDDYYLLSGDEPSGQGGDSATAGASNPSSGTSSGSSDQGGGPPLAGSSSGGTVTAGSVGDTGQAGAAPASEGGASGVEPCLGATERCNGHDDDCDEVVDEFVCKTDCSGFVLPGDPDHGYMFCTASRKANWTDAKKACEDQDMHLAWLDSATENQAIALKLEGLGSDAEILFGATDQGNEGDWLWVGGEQFWEGDAKGKPVLGRYSNWMAGTPNNSNNEDCALLMTDTATWGDRSCNATYPYVCEQSD